MPKSMYNECNTNKGKKMSSLNCMQDRCIPGSERAKPTDFLCFNSGNLYSGDNKFEYDELVASQSLDLIRDEIRVFLENEPYSATAKFIQKIADVYESNISQRDYEIK